MACAFATSKARAYQHDCDGDGRTETYSRDWCPLKPTEDCNYNIYIGNSKIRYCRNRALSDTNTTVDHAVIFIHGHPINARGYYDKLVDMAIDNDYMSSESDPDVSIITPFFMHEEDVESIGLTDDFRHWTENDWKHGYKSANDSGTNYSSYQFMDAIVEALVDNNASLDDIVIAGHSAGAQFVQEYLAGTTIEQDVADPAGVDIKYVVIAPRSYMWLTNSRPGDEQACPGYNDFKFGVAGRSGHPYMNDKTDAELIQEALFRHVYYVVGSNDTEIKSLSCREMVQGDHRLERNLEFFNQIDNAFRNQYTWMSNEQSETYRSTYHRRLVLSGVNHDSTQILATSRVDMAEVLFEGW